MSRPRTAADLARLQQFKDTLAQGRIKAGEIYSAEQLAAILGWHPVTVKRLMPLLAGAQQLGYSLSWDAKEVGTQKRYFFRATQKLE